MIVVGLDLSLTSTGMARIVNDRVHELDRVQTTGTRKATLHDRDVRLCTILQSVLEFVAWRGDVDLPDLVVIESPSYGSKYGSPHDRSGLWWLVTSTLLGMLVPVATVPPTTRAKYATGKGRDDKEAVFAAVVDTYGTFPAVRLTELGCKKGNDMADALVLAAMGARHLGRPIDFLPEKNLEAMEGAAWPSET